MSNPIGYSFNADTYCPACSEIELGQDPDSEDLEDGEGNPIHPIMGWDEAGDTPTHCGRCHAFIDDSWSGETVNYAIEALASWVITSSAGTYASSSEEARSVTVLDTWSENLRWCVMSRRDEAILSMFLSLRDGHPYEAARGLLEYVLELEEATI